MIYGWGPSYKPNFATWLLNNLNNKKEVSVVIDQYASPTLNTNLAEMLLEIAERRLRGILHTAGATRLSRYEFALRLSEAFGLDTDLIKPAKMEEIPWKAKRPRDSSLDVSEAKSALNIKPLELPRALRIMRNQGSL